MSRVVLDLHGARAQRGVDIDALEIFFEHFRTALREYARARAGQIARKGGRPTGRDQAATAFRLVDFRTGSGIATLDPITAPDDDVRVPMAPGEETLSETSLRALLDDVHAGREVPAPVVSALSNARKAMGDDGNFGVEVLGDRPVPKVVIDAARIRRLQRTPSLAEATQQIISGRLHMVETDLPNRRVAVRAQDGVDWTCTYPDELRPLVGKLVEQLVRITGTGRVMSSASGRLEISTIEPIVESVQEALFTAETVPLEELLAEQGIAGPQGLDAFIDPEWSDDEESRRFLEATLGMAE
jgi:hypothetical protein